MNWEELAKQVNRTPGHQLLRINFIEGLPVAYQHYQRALIQKIVTHEGLFSIHLGWEATFQPFLNRWVWTNPPLVNNDPVQKIDGDTTKSQPLDQEVGLVRISYNLWTGNMINSEINPASIDPDQFPSPVPFTHSEPQMSHIEGGIWIISPTYRGYAFDTTTIATIEETGNSFF